MIDEMFWQSLVAYTAVFVAALWLGRRVYRTVRSAFGKSAGDGNVACLGCPKADPKNKTSNSAGAAGVRSLVQLGQPKKRS